MIKIKNVKFLKAAYKKEEIPKHSYKEVAFVGRSNVGKSSLLNMICNNFKLAHVSQKPGKTKSINFYLVDNKFILVDLPGYGFAKVSKKEKEAWKFLIESYLSNRKNLKGVFVLVDSRHPPTYLDKLMIDYLKNLNIPFVVILTKVDKLSKNEKNKAISIAKKELSIDEKQIILSSSKTREGKDKIISKISDFLKN